MRDQNALVALGTRGMHEYTVPLERGVGALRAPIRHALRHLVRNRGGRDAQHSCSKNKADQGRAMGTRRS